MTFFLIRLKHFRKENNRCIPIETINLFARLAQIKLSFHTSKYQLENIGKEGKKLLRRYCSFVVLRCLFNFSHTTALTTTTEALSASIGMLT